MAVEDASFMTTMFSMSLLFRDWKMSADTGAPSSTMRGVVPALMEFTPRRRMDTFSVGSPDEVNTCRPDTWPWRASPALAEGLLAIAFLFTVEAEPTTDDIFLAEP